MLAHFRRAATLAAALALALPSTACARRHPHGRAAHDGEAPREVAATVVTGRFDLAPGRTGTSPDGDTVRFLPDRPGLLCGPRGCPNGINVRVASLDALELHYECGAQDRPLALAARDRLLALLGFRAVRFHAAPDGVPMVDGSTPSNVRGHLLSFGADTTGRRAVGYVFAGDPAEPDGAVVWLDPARVRGSANAALLAEGLAFPAYFADSTTPAVRAALDATVASARARGAGVFAPLPAAATGGPAPDVSRTWPAVARSYCKFTQAGGAGAVGYLRWLANGGPGHRYWLRSGRRWVRLGDVVRADGTGLQLVVPPEDLVAHP